MALAFGLAALLGSSLAAEPWTKASLLAYAQVHAPSLVNEALALQNARDKVFAAASLWQSSVGGSAQVSGGTPAAAKAGTSEVATSVTSTWKPLDQVSLDASFDANAGLRAGASLRPFANSGGSAAVQALEAEQLRYENVRTTLAKAVLSSWSLWARAWLALDIATQDQALKSEALDAEQIRYDAGSSSETTIGAARIAVLDSDKSLWSAKGSEKSARDALLLSVGYTEADFDQQVLATPALTSVEALLARAQDILEKQTPVRESFALAQARLNLTQAQADASVWPSLLGGLAASGSWSQNSGAWSATVSYNLSFSTLVSPQEKTLAQALTVAQTALVTAQLQARSDAQLALYSLQGAVSQLQLAQKQLVPAQGAYDAQVIKSASGSSTAQKLKDLKINVLRAQSSVASAQAELEAQLLSW
jgi:outer membrane protein TolC